MRWDVSDENEAQTEGVKKCSKRIGKKRTYVSKKRKMMVKLTQNREKIFSKKFSVSLV